MAEIIRMPKMSDTMTEGTIASWQKKVGDKVKTGDVLAEVETDKATMELESYYDGVLLHIGVEAGAAVEVDGVLAVIGKEGEDFKALLNGGGDKKAPEGDKPAPAPDQSKPEAPKADKAEAPKPPPTAKGGGDKSAPKGKAVAIRMPKMSDTMTEGTIASWQKKVGDKVKSGDVLAEVETDKATMELEAYEDGVLLHIGIEAGQAVPVDGLIAVVGEQGATFDHLLNEGGDEAPVTDNSHESEDQASDRQREQPDGPYDKAAPDASVASSSRQVQQAPGQSGSEGSQGGRILASPLAKRIAQEKGLELGQLQGSGEGGRIVKRDVEQAQPAAKTADHVERTDSQPREQAAPATKGAASSAPTPTQAPPLGEERSRKVPLSQMRKVIARRLSESMYQAPHFYLTIDINMERAMAARQSINEFSGGKVSVNDLVIKAAAASLRRHPIVNASWQGDHIRYNDHIHIGVAVAVDEGLLVPVVRFADLKPITAVSTEVKELGAKAKNKQLQPADWEGNTFTISNLGMMGIEEFTAIINPPDACIMAVGAVRQVPIVKDGQIAPGQMMKVTLSCDHRIVDGATGAAFLQTFKGMLEDPIRMLA